MRVVPKWRSVGVTLSRRSSPTACK